MRRDFPIRVGLVTAACVPIGAATDTAMLETYSVELLSSARN